MNKTLLFFVIISVLAISAQGFFWGTKHTKVLASNVKSVTLFKDEWTTARRVSAIPQLKCVGGSARKHAKDIYSVQCRNVGNDGVENNVQWECKSDLPKSVRFGRMNVICEGYDHPDDPYILHGSCGLEYTLEYASGHSKSSYRKHRSNHRHHSHSHSHSEPAYSYHSHKEAFDRQSESGGSWFTMFFFAGIVYLCWKCCCGGSSSNQDDQHTNTRRGPASNPDSNRPNQADNNQSKTQYATASSTRQRSAASGPTREQQSTETETESSGPGFLTGAAVGAAVGYAVGSRNSASTTTGSTTSYPTTTTSSYDSYGRYQSSSNARQVDYDSDSSSVSSLSSSDSDSDRRDNTATGFATTTRR